LTLLSLDNNNFASRDLSCLVGFANLKELCLGNINPVKIQQGIYNRLTGSLQPLQSMGQLCTLDINSTDLDGGTEYLSTSVVEI